jgi:outer membrane protein TolC
MSIRHRFLGVYLAFTLVFPLSISQTHAGSNHSDQPVGQVGLRELIALALRNDPALVKLRGQISIEEAEKRAVRMNQWRDPEIRVGFSKDDNVQLDQPYTERGTVRESISDSNTLQNSKGRSVESSRENRSTNYTERVTPGEHSDQIHRTETETRTTKSDGTEGKEVRSETFRSTRDETRFHGRDRLARDQSTSAKIRFWIPKPWETKALINQAAKEVELANYEVTAAEREVILEVREDYEDLQYLYKKLKASTSKIAIIKRHVAKEAALLEASDELTVDNLGFEDIKIPGIEMEQQALSNELTRAKRELAARVGLEDGSRIRVTDKLLRTTINLEGTDLDYLTRMAFVHRGEVGILKHEQAIVESELDIIKSKRIPWVSFIEAAYAKDSTGGNHTNDNYGVQFGVVLPLFSWLSKDEEVVQARIESYYSSISANQKNIANEVSEAFRSVKESAHGRRRAEAASSVAGEKLETLKKRLENSEDLFAIERLRYDVESKRDDFYKYILAADRRYNQSLISLEKALGADLDQVFNYKIESIAGAIDDPDETVAAAAASSKPQEANNAPKAKPVPKLLELPSQKGTPAPAKAEHSKKKGLFNAFKRAKMERAAEQKPAQRGIWNRKR